MSDPTGLIAEASTPGTVVYGILSWRADSQMLARLRPVFVDLIALAIEQSCFAQEEPYGTCREVHSDDRTMWCTPCVLHDLADRIQAIARPTGET